MSLIVDWNFELRAYGEEIIFLEVAFDPLKIAEVENEVEADRIIGGVDIF